MRIDGGGGGVFNSVYQSGGKCPYMPFLGQGTNVRGRGTCPTLSSCRQVGR